jgi:hypothetical protein
MDLMNKTKLVLEMLLRFLYIILVKFRKGKHLVYEKKKAYIL